MGGVGGGVAKERRDKDDAGVAAETAACRRSLVDAYLRGAKTTSASSPTRSMKATYCLGNVWGNVQPSYSFAEESE